MLRKFWTLGAGCALEDDPDALRAMIAFWEAHAAVLRAEPDEYRGWLPEHIRVDPDKAINREIDRITGRLEELAEKRKHIRERERASVRRQLSDMQTAEYARLQAAERAEWEHRLGLDLPPEDRPPKSDALSRWLVPYDTGGR